MKGFGQRYECKLCGHSLHRECRFPKSNVSHEFFVGSTLTFRDRPFIRQGHDKKHNRNNKEYSKICDGCGKEVCGFSYHSETDNLDLHPCCLSLEKKLLMDDTVFDLRPRVRSKCGFCKQRKISDGERDVPGWAYVSACDKYHFHVYCMSEMVHEAWMKNGEMGLEMVKLSRNRGWSGKRAIIDTVKLVLKIILATILGDPTALISSVFVEFVSRGLQ
ncbi:hypothetical protein PHJA_000659400 [Phtheirospermum japonicum]|uniref:DC1 domain-containing protein n=1 Tax=Phtheirospermum japonicum TaxID=374723 RepID=A0A830BDY2_9LAMI|nr:hypothetical protein PHJA_000659400 [Phtheirospermum japonicum]